MPTWCLKGMLHVRLKKKTTSYFLNVVYLKLYLAYEYKMHMSRPCVVLFLTDNISLYCCTGMTFVWFHLLVYCCMCDWLESSDLRRVFCKTWVQCGKISVQRWCSEICTLARLQVKCYCDLCSEKLGQGWRAEVVADNYDNNNMFFSVPFLFWSTSSIAWNKISGKKHTKKLTLCFQLHQSSQV